MNKTYLLAGVVILGGVGLGGYFFLTGKTSEAPAGYHTLKAEAFQQQLQQDVMPLGKMRRAKKVEILNVRLVDKSPTHVLVFREGDRIAFNARLTFDEGVQTCQYVTRIKEGRGKDGLVASFLLETETCEEMQAEEK